MGLTLKEVRVPTPRVRAEKILAALLAGGDLNEYNAAGAIAVTDGVAMLRATSVGMAMTLADSGVGPGDTIRLELVKQNDPTHTVVVTPATLNGGTTITFDAVGEYIVLIWVDTVGWTEKVGTATVA
jgi:plastocyanin